MNIKTSLADRLPNRLRPLLSGSADDERREAEADDVVKAIVDWSQNAPAALGRSDGP